MAFNVRKYGALGTGAPESTEPIRRALVDAGGRGVIEIPGGVYHWDFGEVPKLPRDADGLTIRGAGHGATTIRLSSSVPRAFDLDRTADHQMFRRIRLEDLTVDCDGVTDAGKFSHVLIGSRPGGVQYRNRYEDIEIRRVRIVKVPTDATAIEPYRRRSIWLETMHDNDSESTKDWIRRISLEDVRIDGGETGVVIAATSPGANANVEWDEVSLTNVHHDSGLSSPPKFSANNFHIGSSAAGGRLRMRDCIGTGAQDTAFEVNNATDSVVEGCTARNSAQYHFGTVNYRTALRQEAQSYIWRDCRTETETPDTVPFIAQGSIPIGSFEIQGGAATNRSATELSRLFYLKEVPIRRFTVDGLKVNYPLVQNWRTVWQALEGVTDVRIRDLEIQASQELRLNGVAWRSM